MHHLLSTLFRAIPFVPGGRKRRTRPITLRWVLPNQLAVGQALCKQDAAVLARSKVQTILSLCDEAEAPLPSTIRQQFECVRYALPDSHSPVMLQEADVMAVLHIIHARLAQQRPVYVHCLAGMERSPTICLAYLCLYHGYGINESLTWLKQVNPRTMPTEQQIAVVRSLVATHANFLPQLPAASPHPTLPSSHSSSLRSGPSEGKPSFIMRKTG